MFLKSYEEIKEVYADRITEIWEPSFTIIMTDTDQTVGSFPCSDLIFIFSPQGEMVIMTERLFREKYSFIKWMKLLTGLKLKKSKHSKTYSGMDIKESISYSKEFIDIVHYKKWWHEWARDLV